MTVTARIVLARHGESRWNVDDRYQGHADSGLTPAGHGQAEALAPRLAELLGAAPVRLVSSDLERARHTAAPFAAATGLQVAVDPRLREVATGSWTGQTFAEVAAREPDVVAAAARGEDVRRGGGETFTEVRERVWAAIGEIAADLTTDLTADPADPADPADQGRSGPPTAVLFTHGGAVRVAAAAACGVPAPGHTAFTPPVNCSLTIIDVVDGRARLTAYGLPGVRDAHAARAE